LLFEVGRKTRNGSVSIGTVPEDSCSFSEIVRAVFHFFSGKSNKWAVRRRLDQGPLIDAYAGGNLSDGKIDLTNPEHRRATFGCEEKVFAVQNNYTAKDDTRFKLDFTVLAKGISQLCCQASHTRLALLPPEGETVDRILGEIESQLTNFLICLP